MKVISWKNGWLLPFLLMYLLYASIALAKLQDVYQEDPRSLLQRMSVATQKISYRGVLVYQEGSRLEVLGVTRDANNGHDKERLVFLDGLPREMVRNGERLTYSTPGGGVTQLNYGSLNRFVGLIFDRFYKVSYAGNHLVRVAGREAIAVSIVPVDHYRFGYQFWIDVDTAIPLKSVMLDARGEIIERLQFAQIDSNITLTQQEALAMDKSNVKYDLLVDMKSASEKGGAWGWEAGWVPDGFSVKNMTQRLSSVSGHKVDAVIYSDGVSGFTIFVEPDKSKGADQASDNIGALATVAKVFKRGGDSFLVTVVGEVPLVTVERVAASVRTQK